MTRSLVACSSPRDLHKRLVESFVSPYGSAKAEWFYDAELQPEGSASECAFSLRYVPPPLPLNPSQLELKPWITAERAHGGV